MKYFPLKPGWIIGLRTRLRSINNGLTYQREELEHRNTQVGGEVEAWKTTRTIANREEYEAGTKVRGKVRSLITGAAIITPFGILICPDDQKEAFDAKVAEARALMDAHNDTAEYFHVELDLLPGRISDSTKDAAKAIAGEMRDLLDTLKEATASGDVTSLRDVANKCRSMSKLMEDGSVAKTAVEKALAAARSLGRQIVKEVEKGAGNLQDVLSKASLAPIDTARFTLVYEEEERWPAPLVVPAGGGLFYVGGLVAAEASALYEEEEAEPVPLDIPAEPSRVVYDDPETEEELDPEALERFHREAQERLGLTSNIEPLPWHPDPPPFFPKEDDPSGDLFRDVEQALEGKP